MVMSNRSIKKMASWQKVQTVASSSVCVSLGSLVLSASASALVSSDGPGWAVSSRLYPTYLPPGGSGEIAVELINAGAASSKGEVTVTDVLPPNLTATAAGALQKV